MILLFLVLYMNMEEFHIPISLLLYQIILLSEDYTQSTTHFNCTTVHQGILTQLKGIIQKWSIK